MLTTYLHLLFRWSQKSSHLPGAKQDERLLLHREPGPRGGFQDQNRGEIPLVTSALAVLFCMETILNTYGILPSSVLLSLSENWEMFTWALAYRAVIARASILGGKLIFPRCSRRPGLDSIGNKAHTCDCLFASETISYKRWTGKCILHQKSTNQGFWVGKYLESTFFFFYHLPLNLSREACPRWSWK